MSERKGRRIIFTDAQLAAFKDGSRLPVKKVVIPVVPVIARTEDVAPVDIGKPPETHFSRQMKEVELMRRVFYRDVGIAVFAVVAIAGVIAGVIPIEENIIPGPTVIEGEVTPG